MGTSCAFCCVWPDTSIEYDRVTIVVPNICSRRSPVNSACTLTRMSARWGSLLLTIDCAWNAGPMALRSDEQIGDSPAQRNTTVGFAALG